VATLQGELAATKQQAGDAKRDAARKQKGLSDAGSSTDTLKKTVADLEARLEKERATAAKLQKTVDEVGW
jgi:hypothetical protein